MFFVCEVICYVRLIWADLQFERFYEDLQNLLELTPKKCPFLHRGLECKSRKSRDTPGNRQIWPWSTKWSRAKANKVLPRERTGHSKHPLTTQEKTVHIDITRRTILKSDWLYSLQPEMEKLYTETRPGADCGSDHDLLKPNLDLNWTK